MPTRIETSTDLSRSAVAPTVYTRRKWSDDWTERQYLWCVFAEWCASPKVSSAQLIWEYGTGARQGEICTAAVEPLDIVDHWIKISIPQTTPTEEEGEEGEADDLLWYGRCVDVKRTVTSVPKLQTFQCVGMECLLSMDTIRKAYVDNGRGGLYVVGRGLEFNGPDQAKAHAANRPHSVGNMSPNVGPRGNYMFAGPKVEDLENAKQWHTFAIAYHLVREHGPQPSVGGDRIELTLHDDAALYLPQHDHPRVPTHGRTLKQVLDGLLDRRRGLSYTVEVAADDRIEIRPCTFFADQVQLPSGWLYPPTASQRQIAIDFESALDVRSATIDAVAVEKVDQVRAVGQPLEFCLSLWANDNEHQTTIVEHWSAAQQEDYNAAASPIPGYDDLTLAEQQQRNADYRAREELSRVYCWFGAAAGWPEEPAGIDPDVYWLAILPNYAYTDNGLDPETDRLFYRPTMRFERQLPLRVNVDYSGDYGATDATAPGVTYEYQQPLVFFKLHDDLDSTEDKYQLADKLTACAAIEGTGDGHGRYFSCSVRVQDAAAGLVLKVHGAPQHAIAATDFDGGTDADAWIAIPEYDWRDEMIFTVAIKADWVLEARYPATVEGAIDALRIKTVDASARAARILLVPGTVLGVDTHGDLVTAAGQYIRDDLALLEDAARLAYEWYGQDRKTLRLTWEQVQNAGLFHVGDLVAEIGPEGEEAETIRTVITSIRVTFAQSTKETHTTTIQTQWAELDVMELI